jgi:Protein of unknown function (DUF3370)
VAVISSSDWSIGTLLVPNIVPLEKLKPLTGMARGMPIWKSNNPEVFTSDGWLMQNALNSSRQLLGSAQLSGNFGIYLFHINKSSTTQIIHLLVTNPQSSPVQVSGKGSMFSNSTFPLLGQGTGLNYQVARNWLTDIHRVEFDSVNLAPNKTYPIDQHTLKSSNMIDGHFELITTAPVSISAVVTSTGNLNDAIALSQGNPADGDIAQPGSNRFGREAGICRHSEWAGTTEIEIPATQAHLGLCLNTSNKFTPALQDQTSDYLLRLGDSAERSYANYGHKYDVTLALKNSSITQRRVRLSFGSNVTSPQDRPSFTYNGPIQVNNRIQDVYTKPTAPRNELETVTIAANARIEIRLQFYVPGLITIGQQLILESLVP